MLFLFYLAIRYLTRGRELVAWLSVYLCVNILWFYARSTLFHSSSLVVTVPVDLFVFHDKLRRRQSLTTGALSAFVTLYIFKWTASSEFGSYRLCEQRRFRRACASAQSRQNLRCSLIQAVNQEEPSDRKPDPWPL